MTAATGVGLRSAPARPARFGAALSLLRLLRIELKRSPMPLVLPVIGVLLWFDSYRPSTSQPPLWMLRTFWNMGQGHTIIDFGPFVAAMAAWIGSREGRRGVADLVTTAVRPRWPAQLVTWAAAAIWSVGGYLVSVGIMFGVYAHQGVQGQPPWWWVAVGATAVTAFSAAGFAAGALFPSRFTAPLAAFGGFLLLMMSSRAGFGADSGWMWILPTNSNGNFQVDSGIMYPFLPDLPIARIMFIGGLGVAVLGLMGLAGWAGARHIRVAGAAVTAVGAAVAVTAVSLVATTARLGPHGVVIPALHDAANDRPIAYAPVCAGSGFRVCLNPAYSPFLPDTIAGLAPVAREVAGLPGAPVRADQVGAVYNAADGGGGQAMTIGGSPPVLRIPLGALNMWPGSLGFHSSAPSTAQYESNLQLMFVHALVGAGARLGTRSQLAVQAALLDGAGIPFAAQPKLVDANALAGWPLGSVPQRATGPIYAAARRLASLSPAARRAWLASHLAAVRSGRLTLREVP